MLKHSLQNSLSLVRLDGQHQLPWMFQFSDGFVISLWVDDSHDNIIDTTTLSGISVTYASTDGNRAPFSNCPPCSIRLSINSDQLPCSSQHDYAPTMFRHGNGAFRFVPTVCFGLIWAENLMCPPLCREVNCNLEVWTLSFTCPSTCHTCKDQVCRVY